MTYEEVIMMLEVDATNATGALVEAPTERQRESLNKKIEAYDMAQAASMKQIAKKTIWRKEKDNISVLVCPVCRVSGVSSLDDYCYCCGQRLKHE